MPGGKERVTFLLTGLQGLLSLHQRWIVQHQLYRAARSI